MTNVILPATAFIYWNKEIDTSRETLINCITLAGSIVGQLGFGYLGDRVGRTRLYGIELVVVIFSTIAIGSGSTGYHGTLSFVGWLAAWRFMLGVGIGAEYPLSATITAEYVRFKTLSVQTWLFCAISALFDFLDEAEQLTDGHLQKPAQE